MPLRTESEIKAEYDRATKLYNMAKMQDNQVAISFWAGKVMVLQWVLGLNPEYSKYG